MPCAEDVFDDFVRRLRIDCRVESAEDGFLIAAVDETALSPPAHLVVSADSLADLVARIGADARAVFPDSDETMAGVQLLLANLYEELETRRPGLTTLTVASAGLYWEE